MGLVSECPFCGTEVAHQDNVRCSKCNGVSNMEDRGPAREYDRFYGKLSWWIAIVFTVLFLKNLVERIAHHYGF